MEFEMQVSEGKAALWEQAAAFDGEDKGMDQEYFKRLDENLGALKLGLERVENNLQSGLQRLDQRMDMFEKNVDQRFSNVDQRFDMFEKNVDQRFNNVDQHLDMFEKNVDQHLDKLDLRMDSTTQRLDALFLQHGEINKWLIAMVITIILGVMGLATGLLPVR